MEVSYLLEVTLTRLSEIYLMTSVYEILLYFVAGVVFAAHPLKGTVWYLVLATPHLLRAFFGMTLSRIVPASHDFVRKIEYSGSAQLEYTHARPDLTRKVTDMLYKYYEEYEQVARLYLLLSAVSYALDVISLVSLIGQTVSFKTEVPDYNTIMSTPENINLDVGKAIGVICI